MNERNDLIKKVTRRLVISLGILVVVSASLLWAFSKLGMPTSIWAVVTAFGICGGFIGIQRRLKSFSDDDLWIMANSWPHIFLSPLAGGFLAVILYMIFVSNLLSGEFFPAFKPGAPSVKEDFSRLLDCTADGYRDYAKLIFWSFVAGFSESFVTNIVGSFAKSAQAKADQFSDRD